MKVSTLRMMNHRAETPERASGVPRPGRIDPSGNLFWVTVVGVLVLGLAGLLFWLALGP